MKTYFDLNVKEPPSKTLENILLWFVTLLCASAPPGSNVFKAKLGDENPDIVRPCPAGHKIFTELDKSSDELLLSE